MKADMRKTDALAYEHTRSHIDKQINIHTDRQIQTNIFIYVFKSIHMYEHPNAVDLKH